MAGKKKMMMNSKLIIQTIFAGILACALTGCRDTTDVRLCYESVHPHSSSTTFSFQSETTGLPDTMIILGQRIIHATKYAIRCATANGTGRFLYPAPAENEPDTTRRFPLLQGEYKFLTLNADTSAYDFSRFDSVASSSDKSWGFSTLALHYKAYSSGSAEVRRILPAWKDLNDYTEYVVSGGASVYADSTNVYSIMQGSDNHVTFHPAPITQSITLKFNIEKQNTEGVTFKIDSVVADLSGIPASIDIFSRRMSVGKTYKMLIPIRLTPADSYANTALVGDGSFSALGVMHSNSDQIFTGPGILQVVVFTTVTDHGQTTHRRIQGKINLMYTLNESKLLEYDMEGKYVWQTAKEGVINIVNPLRIDAQDILSSTSGDWGIDKWISSGSTQLVEQ